MIFLRVLSKSEMKIETIAKVLLSQNLVIDLNIKRNVERVELVNNELVSSKICLLTAKTRATLFDKIDGLLNDMFPKNLPEVYALPIMQMDWKQAENLAKDVQTIPKKSRFTSALNRIKRRNQ